MPESKPQSQSDGQPGRRPLPWTEPRVIVDGIIGQVDATVVPRYGGEPTFARLPRLVRRARGPTSRSSASRSTPGSATGPGPGSAPGTSGSRPGCCARTTRRRACPRSPRSRWRTRATSASTRSTSRRPSPPSSSGARDLLERAPRLLTLGGDHTIALPLLRAVHAAHGPVAVVHFDAHLDTWDTYFGAPYTHGTPFRRAFEEGLLDPERLPPRRHPRAAVRRGRPGRGRGGRVPAGARRPSWSTWARSA